MVSGGFEPIMFESKVWHQMANAFNHYTTETSLKKKSVERFFVSDLKLSATCYINLITHPILPTVEYNFSQVHQTLQQYLQCYIFVYNHDSN